MEPLNLSIQGIPYPTCFVCFETIEEKIQQHIENFIRLKSKRFGADYIPDFIVITGQSDSFEVYVVDLKLPTARRFNQDDTISAELKNAIDQVTWYKDWIEKHMDYFKELLLKEVVNKYPDFDEDFIDNLRFNVFTAVIIGRRKDLNDKRRALTFNNTVRIISYDRLIETEKRLIEMRGKNIGFNLFGCDYLIEEKYEGLKLDNAIPKGD